jgi:hypothetical protein
MKKLLLLLLTSVSCYAQSNYFALVSSNTYIHAISKQDFLAGNATRSDTTNVATPVEYIGGYLYPSNFNGYTAWSFPPRIIITTNAVISFNVMTTNPLTVVAGYYRILLHSTNSAAPFVVISNSWLGAVAPTTTNIQVVTITNNFPTNLLVYTTNVVGSVTNISSRVNVSNILSATFSVRIGPVSGDWYPLWITGGKIEF